MQLNDDYFEQQSLNRTNGRPPFYTWIVPDLAHSKEELQANSNLHSIVAVICVWTSYLSERSSSPFPLGLYSCTTYTRRDDDDCDNNVNNIPPKLALSHRILASSLPPKLIQLSSVTMRTNRKFENRSLSLPNNICFCFISLRCALIGTLVRENGPHLRLSTTTTTTTELNHNEEALGRYDGDVNWLLEDRKSI